ncbi:hypothetical protein EIN_411150 [Entamoeba invadens IP1]|uniref:Uncharacterized protein n=1 Tax=Entamoeba invadens IP1 TaxID=370355 RepID=A0A0A1U137_ENTIV|nr:hypothetical protein EIN_411150 [Entamoeba invadens IP1]ELP87762.1 hypothetical protein EIN_411150 [Entamoeba invadens IP1]|eukprot:XP_004254533.1 hypothetical protein EIN_411150 [Entamoeba invadens IP1]
MANNSQKKTVQNNKQKIVISLCFILPTIFFFVFWRFLRGTLNGTAYFVFVVNTLFQTLPFLYTYMISRPVYSEGELLDCGSDLSQEGLLEFVHDIIYFTSFIQLLSSFSFFAMYLYIVVVGYSIYLLYNMTSALPGMAQQPAAPQQEQKKQKIKYKTYH